MKSHVTCYLEAEELVNNLSIVVSDTTSLKPTITPMSIDPNTMSEHTVREITKLYLKIAVDYSTLLSSLGTIDSEMQHRIAVLQEECC